MFGLARQSAKKKHDFTACSGCSLCLLVCPVWRQSRDLSLTPHGRAKAMQHGATAADITFSLQTCTLCGACEPVCPENIDLVNSVMELRRQVGPPPDFQITVPRIPAIAPHGRCALLPDTYLQEHPEILKRVTALLGDGAPMASLKDGGQDIALTLEAGAPRDNQRIKAFLEPLRFLKKIVVADGLLFRQLLQWLPGVELVSLGVALGNLTAIRNHINGNDLYVVDPRAYHADYERMVGHYDRLQRSSGCHLNLDLQRMAIPAMAPNLSQRLGLAPPGTDGQARWILEGLHISRIVVENIEDRAAFANLVAAPVVHLAEVADGLPR